MEAKKVQLSENVTKLGAAIASDPHSPILRCLCDILDETLAGNARRLERVSPENREITGGVILATQRLKDSIKAARDFATQTDAQRLGKKSPSK
tara:strand:+ start:1077 stop:1358 length:282 start_codon:yes stop_codon:yes gene_type:complete